MVYLMAAGEDIRRLEGGVQIVSGTPGRVFDMIKRRVLQTRDIKILVLDEADEMLSKGFKEQIYDVYRCAALPPTPYKTPSFSGLQLGGMCVHDASAEGLAAAGDRRLSADRVPVSGSLLMLVN